MLFFKALQIGDRVAAVGISIVANSEFIKVLECCSLRGCVTDSILNLLTVVGLALAVGVLPLLELENRVDSLKFVLSEGQVWHQVVNSASSDFEHFSWLCFVEFSIVVGPNVDLLAVGSVGLGGEAAGIIKVATRGIFINMLPKCCVSFHVLIDFTATDFVCQFVSIELLAVLVVVLELFELDSHLIWGDRVLCKLY